MHAIIGLGNPGLRYKNTWHNLGFMLVERLAGDAGFRSGRGSFLECRCQLEGQDLLLVKPTTFMNLSGQAVAELCSFYKLTSEDLLVVFDDMDLPLGEIRFRETGSGGNHNGMSHVVQHLGPKVARLRLGFRPPHTVQSAHWKNFVLAPIPESVRGAVGEMLEEADAGVRTLLRSGIREAMNRYNRSARERPTGEPATD
jgi:PTH1 family peptidyl-tRNA hydrolase